MGDELLPLLIGEADRDEIRALLRELERDEGAAASRLAACQAVADALVRVGQLLWVAGALIGPDRVAGASPFQFGSDRTVGVATVAQIGGQLALASIDLLRGENRYAASALMRQLLEVEYLAHAFAAEHDTAAEWLRADRDKRRLFWTPQKMRNRAGGEFIDGHYWSHCDLGGHPTTEARRLLPDHSGGISTPLLWVDLAGHLARIWRHLVAAAEQVVGGPIPRTWTLPDVDTAIEAWHSADRLFAALQGLGSSLYEDGRSE